MLICNFTNTSAGKRKCANVSNPYCAKCQLFGQLFIRRLVQSSLQQQGFLCSGGAPPDLPHGAGPEKHPEPGVRDAMELPIPSRASSALDSKRVKFSAGLWGISGCNSGGILSGSRDSTGRDAFSGFTWQTDRLEGGLGPARGFGRAAPHRGARPARALRGPPAFLPAAAPPPSKPPGPGHEASAPGPAWLHATPYRWPWPRQSPSWWSRAGRCCQPPPGPAEGRCRRFPAS